MPTETDIPTHCKACGNVLQPDPRQGYGDAQDAGYPYCRACHYSGRSHEDIHAEALDVIKAATDGRVAAEIWHGGGGTFSLILYPSDAAFWGDEWDGEQPTGRFQPFACATQAYRPIDAYGESHPHLLKGYASDSEWTFDAGLPEPGEPWGAVFYRTLDAWEGGPDFESAPTAAPLDGAGLAAFALKHLFND